jgi:hypothetical protein
MDSKTVRDFNVNGDVTAIADSWASSSNFKLMVVDPDGTRRYQRGHGLMVNAQHANVRQAGPQVHLEVWTHATLLDRISSFGMLPANMAVESGGLRGMIPRKKARESVNQLLAQLGQPPIA